METICRPIRCTLRHTKTILRFYLQMKFKIKNDPNFRNSCHTCHKARHVNEFYDFDWSQWNDTWKMNKITENFVLLCVLNGIFNEMIASFINLSFYRKKYKSFDWGIMKIWVDNLFWFTELNITIKFLFTIKFMKKHELAKQRILTNSDKQSTSVFSKTNTMRVTEFAFELQNRTDQTNIVVHSSFDSTFD